MKQNYGLANKYTVTEKENGNLTVQLLHHEDICTVIKQSDGFYVTTFRSSRSIPFPKETAIKWAGDMLHAFLQVEPVTFDTSSLEGEHVEIKDIVKKIEEWSLHEDECFFEYFNEHIKIPDLMIWAQEKGYLTEKQFQDWQTLFLAEDEDARWLPYIMHNCHGYTTEHISYSIVKEESWSLEGEQQSYTIFATFISEHPSYQKQFVTFLKEQ